jgi:SAM-dependent methyltransferase
MTPLDGIDIRPQTRGGLADFYLGDIRTWVAPHPYATVIALSTLEHIGLACEGYGTEADDEAEGDRRAVEGCMRALKPGGTLLLTVPFGPKAENRGWYRVYDQAALEDLVDGWEFSAEYHLNPEWAVGGVALVTVYC